MNERILELLYRSFDGALADDEQRELRDALAASQDFRREKSRIEAMRQPITPGTANMERIAAQKRARIVLGKGSKTATRLT